MRPRIRILSILILPYLSLPAVAFAAPQFSFEGGDPMPKSRLTFSPAVSDKEPVLLEADRIDYDDATQTVVASGNVEVAQGDTILIADTLIYDRARDQMSAHGHVSMLEPSGHVYFAESVELRNDIKFGVLQEFRARLSDNSLFAAAEAQRQGNGDIDLAKAVYSPCKVCAQGEDPQWQIKADHITVAKEEQKVYYDDAFFEFYGVPVIYTPYFSHASPGADNASGILMPEYAHNDNLGSVYKVPVYLALAPDYDVTVTPIYTTREGLVMAGEYRQRFDSGLMKFDGSITRPEDRDALGNPSQGRQVRGHFNGAGAFNVDDNHNWGFDIHRTTDDTYLRRYGFGYDTLLTSRAYGEAFNFDGTNDRSYAIVQGLAFQGLTAADNQDTIPLVLPMMDLAMEGDPGWMNSRFGLRANAMYLTRDLGAESRRLSMTPTWRLPYITEGGQVIEFTAQLRGDIYSVDDVLMPDNTQFDGTTGRLVPQASLLWRYPFISRGETASLLLEPVVNFTVSPGGGNPDSIPNEDSLVPEFTDTNLFSPNRFAGFDRIENGPRVSYGIRGQAQLFQDKYVDWLFGQHYRLKNDRHFPFTNDLNSHFSDYVGKVGVSYAPLYVAYRFRLDKDGLSSKRNEVTATYSHGFLSLGASYLSLQNDPVLASKEQVAGTAGIRLTDQWSWSVGANRDIESDYLVSAATGLTYQNECTNLTGIFGREYTRDRDIEPSTTFLLRISLKNLD